ncbi:unnamed protein product, partial [Sphacelaria rigidula]
SALDAADAPISPTSATRVAQGESGSAVSTPQRSACMDVDGPDAAVNEREDGGETGAGKSATTWSGTTGSSTTFHGHRSSEQAATRRETVTPDASSESASSGAPPSSAAEEEEEATLPSVPRGLAALGSLTSR